MDAVTVWSVETLTREHLPLIMAIFNYEIVHSTALYDYHPRTPEFMETWYQDKLDHHYPVMGVVEAGQVLGFGTYGAFRPRPAYKYSVEHSVYVHHAHQGKGVGKTLLQALIHDAERQGYHVLIGGIDSENSGSIALHRQFGFEFSGCIKQAGFKFGKWLNLDFYQKILTTPHNPCDG